MKNKNKPYMLQKICISCKFFAVSFRVYNNDLELDYEVGIGLDNNKTLHDSKFSKKKDFCFFSARQQLLIGKVRSSHSC